MWGEGSEAAGSPHSYSAIGRQAVRFLGKRGLEPRASTEIWGVPQAPTQIDDALPNRIQGIRVLVEQAPY